MKSISILIAALALATSVAAQTYPNKPIRLVTQGPAGSLSDNIVRTIGKVLGVSMGQPVVIDNKPGGDGVIAAADVQKSAPDGYTLLFATNSPMAAVPAMKKNPPYDPVGDFTPITNVGHFTFFLFVNASVPAKTLPELLAFAKANPGKLSYGSGNSTGIVGTAQILSLANVKMLHVPYKGEPQAMTDLVGGRIDLMWATPTTGLPLVKDGKLRAVATSLKERSPMLPEVPTIYEALPQFSIVSWGAIYGPAGMPRELVQRLNRELVAVMKKPEVIAAMGRQGVALSPSTPEQLAAYLKEQIEAWKRTVASADIQPE